MDKHFAAKMAIPQVLETAEPFGPSLEASKTVCIYEGS